ncbi:MAG: VanZ family protein [Paludibacter sp.]
MSIIRNYWKSTLTLLAILYLSFTPTSEFNKLPPIKIEYLDKIVHVVLYSFFTFILVTDFSKNTRVIKNRRNYFIFSCIVFPLLFGAFVEIAQELWFYPRSAEWIDWFADILGVSIGLIVMCLFKKIKFKPCTTKL